MGKLKKIILINILFILIILSGVTKVFANNFADIIKPVEYTEEYKKYLELSDEERKNVIQPFPIEIQKTKAEIQNPILLARATRNTVVESSFSLKNIISNNLAIKDQMQTGSCWAFAALSSLETNLALTVDSSKVYDFSERHMEYATSRVFANNEINPVGFNRNVGDGGGYYLSIPYLTNGTGAIPEEEMIFENNEDTIYISEIQDKSVVTEVSDIVVFPSYSVTEDLTEIKQEMKSHIKEYGSISASIHGASLDSEYYNNSTGAIYCDDEELCVIDHAVSIIGWDDNYSVENFNETHRPTSNGAWIIRNSWGEKFEYTLDEMKEYTYELCIENQIDIEWTEPSLIPDDFAKEFFQEMGYTIENDVATLTIGDNGLMYMSYEDVNIYKSLYGITKSSDEVSYDNIYQYDILGSSAYLSLADENVYLANIFEKQTSGAEYLTKVSLFATETYTCKVYVNPNSTSTEMSNLQQVQLQAGETETFDAGYHTLEFAEPIEITGDEFVVVVEIQGTNDSVTLGLEANGIGSIYDVVTVEDGKCLVTYGENFNNNSWVDLSKLTEINSGLINGDSTIKAFTVAEIPEEVTLSNIEITTPPTKTTYFEGEDFDKTGMVVTANYSDGTSSEITTYNITDGTNLQEGQTSVTITYENQTVTQEITVNANNIESLTIVTPPTKTEYNAGEDFETAGMVVQATYTNGATEIITDYKVVDGTNLKNGQTTVTISYNGITITQEITVNTVNIVSLEITTPPTKTEYIVGQDFETEGMVVSAIYEDGRETEITDYTIENGTNLALGQTSVRITFENLSVEQPITVVEKTVQSISIVNIPTKIQYIQNKEELDLTGGVIEVIYTDGSSEEIDMTSENITVAGFSNEALGEIALTISYEGQTVQFTVEIIEGEVEEQPENSNFDNSNTDVTTVKIYTFSDSSEEEYMLIDIEVNNVIRNLTNDEYEYYYYLSTNPNEENIENWVLITETQEENDKITFTINTRDISNYDELYNADTVYLYINEVVTKGGNQSSITSPAMQLDTDTIIETYVDNIQVTEPTNNGSSNVENPTPSNEQEDPTTSKVELPYTGIQTVIILLVAISIIGIISYFRHRNLRDIK